MNIAPRFYSGSEQGTAHPPVPRQPSMRQWIESRRKPTLRERLARLIGKGDISSDVDPD